VARKIATALAQPCVLGEGTAHATVSIGIAFYPNDATDPLDLVKKADLAMYRAKNLGKNCVQTFRADPAPFPVESRRG
jgi:diguanylate cyclase (GGDEF)-like protein